MSRVEIEDEVPSPVRDINLALDLRNSVLDEIVRFEESIRYTEDSGPLLDDEGEETPTYRIEEVLEDHKRTLRDNFYTSLRSLFSSVGKVNEFTPKFYEDAVYHLLSDRLMRTLGYYQALSRANEDIMKVNEGLGDAKGIVLDFAAVQKTLSSIDEVDFVRSLGITMGLKSSDLDEIVSQTIAKEFAPVNKSTVKGRRDKR